mgnify:CR=1 FL=1
MAEGTCKNPETVRKHGSVERAGNELLSFRCGQRGFLLSEIYVDFRAYWNMPKSSVDVGKSGVKLCDDIGANRPIFTLVAYRVMQMVVLKTYGRR